ncbi:cache domain-containing protein [Seleniivibrio sp.]|uniref:cache domain-containing protein n=1 Tax=Seleniivibrio sp. TaxID=2898801 RepID=UPI00260097B0|nr:cache domain-containing protein [Seleniivibrio sp.]MCD8554514.1 cache domain-containing protein [Seleniivibrio sp.]
MKTNIPVWVKVVLPIGISVALFVFIIFGIHIPDVEKRLLEQKKSQIYDLTQTAIDVISYQYKLSQQGKITEKEAKKQAAAIIGAMKFGPERKDYFWITNYEPRMVMHPYRTDLDGKMLDDFADPKGKHVFNEMVHAVKTDGEGFVDYMWQWKDDSGTIIPKISYVKAFPEWQWIVGTGIYIDDIKREAASQVAKLIFYTISIFFFILILSGYTIMSGVHTNEALLMREKELENLNSKLEDRVSARTKDLQESLENLKRTQNQLIEAEKMASLGNLVAGVAHEINTPVGIGVTTATYLEDKLKALIMAYNSGQMKKSDLDKFFETAEQSLHNISTNLLRAGSLVRSFKQVAVDQSSELPRKFSVKNYLNDILQSLSPKLKNSGHNVYLDVPEDLIIESYPGALMQIFSNLIINSLMHGFDEIENGIIEIKGEMEGTNLILTYSDNGVGMNEEQLARIYEPFYTTKRNAGGSGLGMNIVYNLISRKLNGTISIQSKPGQGTTFKITVPVKGERND